MCVLNNYRIRQISLVKDDSLIGLIIYLASTDDWEYWLKKKRKRKSTIQRFIYVWEVDRSNLSELDLNT
jgi:hypothetical protein